MAILQGAEPFLLAGGRRGVLLIHGFTGSPSEMRLLGRYLHARGFTVLAPRLCGHGTSPEEMATTIWPHWYSSVQDGYHLLRDLCADVSVVGLSLGGLLALQAGLEYPVGKTAVLSTPIYISSNKALLLPTLRQSALFGKYARKKRRPLDVDPRYSIAYEKMPLSSLTSLMRLIRHIDGKLPEFSKPLLIVQSKNDHTVVPGSADHIFQKVGSSQKELFWLEKSGHIVTLDTEHEAVFQKIGVFLNG